MLFPNSLSISFPIDPPLSAKFTRPKNIMVFPMKTSREAESWNPALAGFVTGHDHPHERRQCKSARHCVVISGIFCSSDCFSYHRYSSFHFLFHCPYKTKLIIVVSIFFSIIRMQPHSIAYLGRLALTCSTSKRMPCKRQGKGSGRRWAGQWLACDCLPHHLIHCQGKRKVDNWCLACIAFCRLAMCLLTSHSK